MATAPIKPLAWEPPYAAEAALDMAKKKEKKRKEKTEKKPTKNKKIKIKEGIT